MDNNQDDLAAFCDSNDITVPATSPGDLDGLNFATKDVMDVAGSITGFGQPEWLRTHVAATQHARAVGQLLGAGAAMARKTVTDELSYSLTGENVHYGTPVNSAAVGRVCGGSSSGSAAAVAGGLVDFALGTDCAGSVRLPASYCGLYGMRPSHNQVSTEGVIPFAPSFDTVGWLARDADVLNRAGRVLLQAQSSERSESEIVASKPARLLLASDCFDLVDSQVRQALMPAVQHIASCVGNQSEVVVSEAGLEPWMECFRTIQGYEIWQSLGSWIETNKPTLGPGVDDRVAAASKVTLQDCDAAREFRQTVIARLASILQPGDVLCLPSSPRVAPLRDTATSTVEVTYRYQAICLLSIAGLGGLPEISLPLCRVEGLPLGVSLVGARGTDLELLELASRIDSGQIKLG